MDEQGRFIPEGPPVTNTAGTAQPFRLRVLLHVDANGAAQLLSNVYAGEVSTIPPGQGFTARQSALVPEKIGKAARITATLGQKPRSWREALKDYLQGMRS